MVSVILRYRVTGYLRYDWDHKTLLSRTGTIRLSLVRLTGPPRTLAWCHVKLNQLSESANPIPSSPQLTAKLWALQVTNLSTCYVTRRPLLVVVPYSEVFDVDPLCISAIRLKEAGCKGAVCKGSHTRY